MSNEEETREEQTEAIENAAAEQEETTSSTESGSDRGDDRRRGRDRDTRSAGPRGGRGGRPQRESGGRGRRRGRNSYCPEGRCFDYKDVETLRRYLTDVGKIKPRRQTGNCARCQRQLAQEVKRARHLALLPFVIAGD